MSTEKRPCSEALQSVLRQSTNCHIYLLSEIVQKAQHTTPVTTNKKHAMLCIYKRRLTIVDIATMLC